MSLIYKAISGIAKERALKLIAQISNRYASRWVMSPTASSTDSGDNEHVAAPV